MQRFRHLVLAIVAGLALAIGFDVVRSGGPEPWLALRRPAPAYEARGRLVDIGGRSLYLDCRGAGSPTVVLEAGMGDTTAGWAPVHDALAATTRTCAYDRAGRGRSDPRERHTLRDAAADLRRLLSAASEPGPFVVVGHSLGGSYARVFADAYRDEVVGLVSVDAFDPDLEAAWIHPLLGGLQPEYAANLDELRALVARVESLDWTASEEQLIASDLRGLPIEVMRPPRAEPRLDEAANVLLAAAIADAYGSLSPGLVRFELAWGAGHMVQVDRPDMVVAAVARLVAGSRAAGLP